MNNIIEINILWSDIEGVYVIKDKNLRVTGNTISDCVYNLSEAYRLLEEKE